MPLMMLSRHYRCFLLLATLICYLCICICILSAESDLLSSILKSTQFILQVLLAKCPRVVTYMTYKAAEDDLNVISFYLQLIANFTYLDPLNCSQLRRETRHSGTNSGRNRWPASRMYLLSSRLPRSALCGKSRHRTSLRSATKLSRNWFRRQRQDATVTRKNRLVGNMCCAMLSHKILWCGGT
jgi:hypothetical protein